MAGSEHNYDERLTGYSSTKASSGEPISAEPDPKSSPPSGTPETISSSELHQSKPKPLVRHGARLIFVWTEEALAELKRLHAAKLSYRQIAKIIGVSRASISSKAHHLGLPFRGGEELLNRVWHAEKREKLRELHAAGKSFSQIAAALGVTRNSAIGAAYRLELPKREKETQRQGSKPKAKRIRSKSKFARLKPPTSSRRAKAAGAVFPLPEIVPAAPPLMIALLDLKPHHCRWPIGDPRQSGFGFCGHEREYRSYCAFHALAAFTHA